MARYRANPEAWDANPEAEGMPVFTPSLGSELWLGRRYCTEPVPLPRTATPTGVADARWDLGGIRYFIYRLDASSTVW